MFALKIIRDYLFVCLCFVAVYEIALLHKRVNDIHATQQNDIKKRCVSVSLSAYTASADETDGTPDTTATGTKTTPGRSAAVSRDLVPTLMGRRVYVPGHGVWVVEDVMHPRFKSSMDLCVPTKDAARKFGRKDGVAVVLE